LGLWQTVGCRWTSAWRPACRLALSLALLGLPGSLPAGVPPATTSRPLTFGILPIGGPSESLQAWQPMLDDMSQALHVPIRSISVSTYEGLAEAIAEQRVDVAFVSGRLALQAVSENGMQVIAQLTRSDGSRGYYAVLLVQKQSPIRTLTDLFRQPGHWRYARGESLSMSGYLVPETQLFASRGLDSDTFFASVKIDNHQDNALAVANGEVDVATNNTADLERFATHFPDQYAHLRVLWKSALIPHAVIVVRNDLAPELRATISDFVTHYAQAGPQAAAELAKLHLIHDISGFAPARNDVLVPFADIEYSLERRRTLGAAWVSPAAMQVHLAKIEADHRQLVARLQADRTVVVGWHGDNPP
jgi:phosphonate transport system substrate-binding protein